MSFLHVQIVIGKDGFCIHVNFQNLCFVLRCNWCTSVYACQGDQTITSN